MKSLLFLQLCCLGSVLANELPNDDEKNVWNRIGAFGQTLSQTLNSLNPNGNMLVSPMSVATALNMALVGAKGSTKQEMLSALQLQGINDDSLKRSFSSMLSRKHENTTKPTDPFPTNLFTLLAANRMYASTQYKIKDEYKADVVKNFHADALNVDFVKEAPLVQKAINSFVEEKTNGLIKDVLKEPLSTSTILALVNTLYFKGQWLKRMHERSAPTVFNEGCGDLRSEHQKLLGVTSRFKYIDSAALQAQMILIPYMSGKFSAEMLILLPKTEHNCKSHEWFKNLAWNNIKSEFKKMTYENIALEMPAFELNGRYSLQDVLPSLGMPLAFTAGKANFSGISDEKLNIDQVIHQTKMIVTQYGTEASAATVVAINRLAAVPTLEPISMNINRSFYLSIIYRYNQDDEALLPLFTGVVNKV